MKSVLALGTNIGDTMENLRHALDSLNHLPGTRVERVSSFYVTKPWGYANQDNFLNICAELETTLSPKALLGASLGIEAAMGRERPFKNSPRIIDIDIIFYEDVITDDEELTLPHPRFRERAFVLCPMGELFDDKAFKSISFRDAFEKCDKTEILEIIPFKQETPGAV